MAVLSAERHAESVSLLSEAADSMLEATSQGLAVDAAVKGYAEQSDNELARAFEEEYVKTMDAAQGDEPLDERRDALLRVTERISVPEVTAFANALIEAQDKRFSAVKTLQYQSEQLHRKLSSV
jgi:hypothetical protein